ncbi:uncharacterized protein [Lolium perenne]|uniref:uncharacterized protein n=1 Tax=Lolium perenne TaxID=4522 RepID=UPI0021EAC392|nr:inactive protein RESTRICTED TEV MOVEMENT 2-like [Lolium perenne]
MDKNNVAGGRAYEEEEGEELDPAVEWKQAGEEQDVVEIRLPGFRKEHVRVQVDNYGVLRVTGGRPARGGRWVRFTKDLRLPDGCDADGVRARFEDDRLLITLPIVPAAAGDAASPTTPSPEPLPRTSSFQPPSSVPPPPLPPPPLLEEMKKKEKKKMEGRKARETANAGNGTPPEVTERREVSPNLLTPASRDPISTTELVANMAAAAAVLVGIAVSVWHTMSGSS